MDVVGHGAVTSLSIVIATCSWDERRLRALPTRSPGAVIAVPPKATRALTSTSSTEDRFRPSIIAFASLSSTVAGRASLVSRIAASGGPGMPG